MEHKKHGSGKYGYSYEITIYGMGDAKKDQKHTFYFADEGKRDASLLTARIGSPRARNIKVFKK